MPSREIHAALPADCGIDLAEQCGGHMDDRHPAVIAGCEIAGEVGHHAAADGDHGIAPGQSPLGEPRSELAEHVEPLGSLAVLDDERLVLHPRIDGDLDAVLGHDGRTAHTGGEERGELVSRSPPDDHRIAATVAERDVLGEQRLVCVVIGQRRDHRGGNPVRVVAASVGDDHVGGGGVEPESFPVELTEPGLGSAAQQRAGPIAGQAVDEDRHRRVDPHHDRSGGQCPPVGGRDHDPTASGDDRRVGPGQGGEQVFVLELPEPVLAVGGEDVGDRSTDGGLDVGVEIHNRSPELDTEPVGDARLADGGEPDQHDRTRGLGSALEGCGHP